MLGASRPYDRCVCIECINMWQHTLYRLCLLKCITSIIYSIRVTEVCRIFKICNVLVIVSRFVRDVVRILLLWWLLIRTWILRSFDMLVGFGGMSNRWQTRFWSDGYDAFSRKHRASAAKRKFRGSSPVSKWQTFKTALWLPCHNIMVSLALSIMKHKCKTRKKSSR